MTKSNAIQLVAKRRGLSESDVLQACIRADTDGRTAHPEDVAINNDVAYTMLPGDESAGRE